MSSKADKLIFVNRFADLIKLTKLLRNECDNFCIVTLSEEMKEKLSKTKYSVVSAYDFGCSALGRQIAEEAMAAAKKWLAMVEAITGDRVFSYRGVNMKPVIIHLMFSQFFQPMFRGIRYCEMILRSRKFSRVYVFDDGSLVCRGIIAYLRYAKIHGETHDFSVFHTEKRICTAYVINRNKNFLRFVRDLVLLLLHGGNAMYSDHKSNKVDQKKIIYLPTYPNRVRLVRKVLNRLLERGYKIKIVAYKKRISGYRRSINIEYAKINDYFSSAESLIRMALAGSYSKSWLNRKIGAKNKVKLDNLSEPMNFFLTITFQSANRYFCSELWYMLLRSQEIVESIIRREIPSLVLFNTDDDPFGKVFALAARSCNVRILNLDHGLRINSPRHEMLVYPAVAVSGYFSKEVFLEKGANPRQIHVTGAPIHDDIFDRLQKESDCAILDKLKLSKANKTVLLCSDILTEESPYDAKKVFISSVVSSLRNLPFINLIIKLHPQETDKIAKAIVNNSECKDRIRIVSNFELYDLLRLCNLQISDGSTTSVEAILFNKPVLVLNFIGITNNLKFCIDDGFAKEITDPQLVSQSIEDLLYSKEGLRKSPVERSKFIEKHAYRLDGKSSTRVVDLIESIVRTGDRR